jgi:hypothetical protein
MPRIDASLGKHKRKDKSTTMMLIGKQTAVIDFYHRIDPETRLPGHSDRQRRVGMSGREDAHGIPPNSVGSCKGFAEVLAQ